MRADCSTSPIRVAACAVALVVSAAFASAAGAQAGAPAFTVPDTLAQRVQPCTQCHGKEGRSTNRGYYPRIAGKPAGYLYHQLLNFRDGRRRNETMAVLVEHLSDDYLREIAEHFAAIDLPYPPPLPAGSPATMARGEALARRGDAALGVPACSACHGRALTGVAPAIPGLLGLPRDYLGAQFGAWRAGERRAAAPDCMAQITARLSADDIAAVSTWLAAQPVGGPPAAAAAAALPLPLPCGSAAP